MSVCRRSLQILEKCKNMKQLKQTHAQIITGGLSRDNFVLSRIMAFCSDPVHGSLSHAQLLYHSIESPTLCVVNTLIKSFLLNEEYIKPIELYSRMSSHGLNPDNYTFPYIFKACTNLRDLLIGEIVHARVVKLGFNSDIYVNNTLIPMYMACGESGAAREVFDGIPQRTAVSWTVMINGLSKLGEVENAREIFDQAPVKDRGIWGSMISGYVQNNCFKEGLLMFRLMQTEGVEPDEGVFVSILSACAQLGAMDIGSWIHHYLDRKCFQLTIRLGTALIDMYAKCGNLGLARSLFDEISSKDTVCWNVMILGLAMHGHGNEALDLFYRMKRQEFIPDETTFLAVLTACSHSGMIEEGKALFKSMKTEYRIEPKGEHYGCIVDFLGRAGLFEEAKNILESMPISTSSTERAIAWRALLSCCWNYGEIELAEIASGNIVQLEAHSGAYVLLSNVYEKFGRHEDSRRTRKSMKERGVNKTPGCSSIELGGCVHEFIAGEQMHSQIEEIYEMLENLTDHW